MQLSSNGPFNFIFFYAVLITLTTFLSLSPVHASYLENYDTAHISIKTDTGMLRATLVAKIADNPTKRYRGLRYVSKLDTGTGMLFAYPEADYRTFTMDDMKIPIDILFFDSSAKLISFQSLSIVRTTIKSPKPARWILEVNRGWSQRHNLKQGDQLIVDR